MKNIFIVILLFLFFCQASCQKQIGDDNCRLINKELIVYSEDIKDTIFVKVYARHNISKQFEKADALRISYKIRNTDRFSESVDIKNNNTGINDLAYSIHETIKDCHNKYSKDIYEEQMDRIEKLKQNGIGIYNHYVFVIIYPK